MQNLFLPHESDFGVWVESHFARSQDKTLEYLRFLADPADELRPREGGLWPHQWDALLRVIYSREVLRRDFWEDGLLLNVVTGGGKTALMAATMAWLQYAYDIQRFLILCPNLIVRDRLEADFAGGKIFTERDLIPPDAVFGADAFALTTLGGTSKASTTDLFGANVVLANIHQFYRSSKTGQQNLWALFGAQSTPFAIFNDEAHNSPAPEYDRTLIDLREHDGYSFRLDTTATPDRADGRAPDSSMIFEYDIPAALNEGVISKPVVYQPNIDTVELTYTDQASGEQRRVEEIDWDEIDKAGLSATQWVTDPKPMSQQISIAWNRLQEAKRNANGRYHPVLFVVSVCKADARAAQKMLKDQFNLRTLLVTEDEDESAREDAAAIGRSGKYDAVVSVAMLREGWDVPEVAVVLLLRKLGSKVYGPQIVGRGLRRVRRPDVSPDEPQICAVVDHPKLDHEWLWDLLRARVRRDVDVQQTFNELEERGDPLPKQRVVQPDLIIEIPKPTNEESQVLEVVVIEKKRYPSPNWAKLLESLDYGEETVEITDQKITGVMGRELTQGGWVTHTSGPGTFGRGELESLGAEELLEKIQERLKQIGGDATVAAGYSLQMRRYVDRPLREHIEARFLDGEPLVYATEESLRHAASRLNDLERHLMERTDIIGGMIEHADH